MRIISRIPSENSSKTCGNVPGHPNLRVRALCWQGGHTNVWLLDNSLEKQNSTRLQPFPNAPCMEYVNFYPTFTIKFKPIVSKYSIHRAYMGFKIILFCSNRYCRTAVLPVRVPTETGQKKCQGSQENDSRSFKPQPKGLIDALIRCPIWDLRWHCIWDIQKLLAIQNVIDFYCDPVGCDRLQSHYFVIA